MSRARRQSQVYGWCASTFGESVALDMVERVRRLLEEAAELAQVDGLSEDSAVKLIRHVYSKPPGKRAQEVGGVGVTLLAYCEAAGLSADYCERDEIDRILSLPHEYFRKRQNIKAAIGVAEASK
jgi:hypothetical protein